MNRKHIATALALTLVSTGAFANEAELKNPFKSERNKVQDISFTYGHASYMETDQGKHYTLIGSKSLNRFMFVDAEINYNDNSKVDGWDYGFGLGFNYPLPLPLDVAIADIYIKGGYETRSYDEYLDVPPVDELVPEDTAYLSKVFLPGFANGSSVYGVAGLKSNFGSEDIMINMYAGMEKISADNTSIDHLIDSGELEDTYFIGGFDFGYMLTKTTAFEVKTKYQYEEASIGVGVTMYVF